MQVKKEDLKQWLIDNGKKETTGVANNKIEVYTSRDIHPTIFSIDSYGNVLSNSPDGCFCVRYNTSKDTVQIGTFVWRGNYYHGDKFTDLNKNDDIYFFTSMNDIVEYRQTLLTDHKEAAINAYNKKIKDEKKQLKLIEQQLKNKQKIIKDLEKQIKNLEKD